MGLFDKKICDICGEKIGLLGNRKLDDGNLCKDCAKKLSPWFEDRRHSTVEDIKRQLEYREKNKKAVMDFCITRQINTRNYNVFIDDNKGNFTVARKLDVNENPDIVPLSAVVQCRVDVERQQNEETYTTKDGETVSYQPPVYKYEFDYTMRIKVKTPWFDDMDFRLNTFSISSDNRGELMEVEQTGHQIIAALTPNAAGMQQPGMNMNSGMQQPGMNMNSGMQQPGMNMNNGMQQSGMQMNNGMQQSGMYMNNGMQQPGMNMNNGMQQSGMQMNNGMQQSGMYMNNGMQQPGMNMNSGMQQSGMNMNNGMQQPGMQESGMNMNNGMQQPGMQMNNGMQQPGMQMNNGIQQPGMQQPGGLWKCQCGAENTGRFCEYCGQPRPF
ncbi:DUF4428 domain-containing protein [Blautia sp. MSJ-36]|uniref:DUF4428 domain-containing protein n=1 Tax=Blautia sp. MSJ-36 TaxID=2841530 RepID=UPI001C0F6BFB|nr:DUF4428 domain-containing protein [Blautia sp. MSJ-36]MBU5448515.1 DUF4428 domain-containing protein [Blautia sp. MSJ-36]